MIDPDEEMLECENCGCEYYYHRRYSFRKNNGLCKECNDGLQDVADDMRFQEMRDKRRSKQ